MCLRLSADTRIALASSGSSSIKGARVICMAGEVVSGWVRVRGGDG